VSIDCLARIVMRLDLVACQRRNPVAVNRHIVYKAVQQDFYTGFAQHIEHEYFVYLRVIRRNRVDETDGISIHGRAMRLPPAACQ
jgi:hypothetical protein